ncbi:MAG TPA: hypothetical protein VGK38_11135 [Prolixibacteraceae bacterium]|jgi:hypothetical protein
MKQFIICPECGSLELATIEERAPERWNFHRCIKCKQLIPGDEWHFAKAISIRQPWAYLIGIGLKDIENRTWKTKFRGRVLIHVGAINAHNWVEKVKSIPGAWNHLSNYTKDYRNSAIIGSVEIYDCTNHTNDSIKDSKSIWAETECWHWWLRNPILFENPILNVKGKLSFFIPQLP